MRREEQVQRSQNYSHLPAGQAGSPQRFSLARWGRGQSTLEYFIIFAVIACVFIPLWAGKTFSKVKDSGNGFFTACVDRIVVDNNSDPSTGPADITLGSNFPNPFSTYTRFAMVIKDNSCDFDIIITSTEDGDEVGRVECRNMAPGTYGWEGNAGVEPARYWYPKATLASGNYFWYIKMVGADADIHNIDNNNGLKMTRLK